MGYKTDRWFNRSHRLVIASFVRGVHTIQFVSLLAKENWTRGKHGESGVGNKESEGSEIQRGERNSVRQRDRVRCRDVDVDRQREKEEGEMSIMVVIGKCASRLSATC